MKQISFILIVLVLIATGCGQGQGQGKRQGTFDIQQIDSVTYFAFKESAGIQHVDLVKLTDLDQAKELLNGRVIWSKYDEDLHDMVENEEGDAVYRILFDSGKVITYNYPELYFIAYYPEEDILFLEGGHLSSHIYNLTTGEETEEVGDPDYWRDSPSGRYRFNGYYSGQSSVYFIQEKLDTKYQTIIDLDYTSEIVKSIGFSPEYLPDMYWQNDSTLNFFAPHYSEYKTENLYYQLILK